MDEIITVVYHHHIVSVPIKHYDCLPLVRFFSIAKFLILHLYRG